MDDKVLWRGKVFDYCGDAMLIFDTEKRIIDANKAAVDMFGQSVEKIVGESCDGVFFCERGGHHCFLNNLFHSKEKKKCFDHTFMDGSGNLIQVFITASPILNDAGDVIGGVEVLRRAEEIREIENNLIEESRTDSLTGLMNRRMLNEILEIEAARAQRHIERFSLLMIDIDHFKKYNDTYGHQAGDDVLRLLSDTLRGNSRKEDFVARYGGEEFVVILPETETEGAVTQAERIRTAVSEITSSAPEINGAITVSIGVATCDMKSLCGHRHVLSQADKALYRAKSEGRNRVVSYDEP